MALFYEFEITSLLLQKQQKNKVYSTYTYN